MNRDKIWFIKIEDSVLGPFKIDDLQKMLDTGELTADDLIKQHDFGAYSRVDTFEMFRAGFAKNKARPFQEDLSIFMDQAGGGQATQTTMLRDSPEVKAEVKQAAIILKHAERDYLGKNRILRICGLICVFILAAIVIGYFAFQQGIV